MSVSTRYYKQSARFPKHQPLPWRRYFNEVLVKDFVLWIALVLAVSSCLVVRPPLEAYAEYIDFKTLACLASLMTASGGFMVSGVFDLASVRLVNRCRTARALRAAMIFTTFFASMIVTNDVALIVFVPMTLLAFRRVGLDPTATVVLQTIAANVGSIILPMGNPQNVYLYSRYAMPFAEFFRAVFPLSLAGAVLLSAFCIFTRNNAVSSPRAVEPTIRSMDVRLYAALFLVAVFSVFGVIDYRIAFAAAIVVILLKGRILAQQVDYALLLTFIGFFVFVGNIAHIPQVEEALKSFIEPRPYLAAVLASQVISNVPAALMLSGFTSEYKALLAGVSAGGCGTLIASMASLISYKLFVRANGRKGRYLLVFTLLNMLFLAVMTIAYLFSSVHG
jgi:Na+/H+ antiporter NhaD/arsenite permease-like protein